MAPTVGLGRVGSTSKQLSTSMPHLPRQEDSTFSSSSDTIFGMGLVYRAATTSSLLGSTSMSPTTSPSCWMCMDMDTSAGRAGSARMSGLEAGPWGVDSTGQGAGAVHLHGLALVQTSGTPLPDDPTTTAVWRLSCHYNISWPFPSWHKNTSWHHKASRHPNT